MDEPTNGEKEKYRILSPKLTKIATALRAVKFPLFGGFQDEKFSKEIREDATFLHRELCEIFRNCEEPESAVKDIDLLDALKCVISGTTHFDDYLQSLKRFDASTKCNAVWSVDRIAYRCATCAFNPCMSLCADCFLNGNHDGHDYNRFFSQGGGACDCGNDDVLDVKGFCCRHAPDRVNVGAPPIELTALLEYVLVKLFVQLLNTLRRWHRQFEAYSNLHSISLVEYGNSPVLVVTDQVYAGATQIVSIIQYFLDQSSPITEIIASILLDEALYSALNTLQLKTDEDDKHPIEDLGDSRIALFEDINTMPPLFLHISPEFSDSYTGARIGCLTDQNDCEPMSCRCLLDELMFYLIRLFFPQSLINLLLCLLPDTRYKEAFSCKYFGNYAHIAALVLELMENVPGQSNDTEELTGRITHVSVQVCSSLNICRMLEERIQAIDKIFNTGLKITFVSPKQLELNNSKDAIHNREYVDSGSTYVVVEGSVSENLAKIRRKYFVIDVERNRFVACHGYLYFTTDIQNITSHPELAAQLLDDERLCEKYACFIASMQAMNTMWRIVSGNHVEVDKGQYCARVFSFEFDASAVVMFNTMAAIRDAPQRRAFANVLRAFSTELKVFFKFSGLENGYQNHHLHCQPYAVTFHLPLHRHLSYALWQAIAADNGGEYAEEFERFVEDEQFLRLCIFHPIRIHAAKAEHYAGMWVRNGAFIRSSTSFYDRAVFVFGIQNADLFFVRFCAANINQEFFLNVVYNSFYIADCIKLLSARGEDDESKKLSEDAVITSPNWIPYMFDGCMRLLLELVAQNVYAGMSVEDNLRAELVYTLSIGSFPHSRLRMSVPERGMKSQKDYTQIFDSVLEEVAEYQEPDQGDNIRHGQYKLKDSVWLTEFDPVFARMRSTLLKDYNAVLLKAEERELAHLRLKKEEHLWVGYQLIDFDAAICFPRLESAWALLTQPTFFHIMHQILKQALIVEQEISLVLQQAVYLLSLAVNFVNSKRFDLCASRLYHIGDLPAGDDGEENALLNTPFHAVEVRDAVDRRAAVLSLFTLSHGTEKALISLIVSHFERCYEKQDASLAEIYTQLMCNYIASKPDKRIFGSAKDYFGRLLCLLYKSDVIIRELLDSLYEAHVLKKTENQLESVSLGSGANAETNEPAKDSEKKSSAKRKQAALLQSQRLKHARLMQKMMSREGLSQAEMDEMDTKEECSTDPTAKDPHNHLHQRAALVYECPICNDSSTCTLNNLMGLFVHVQSNQLCDSAFNVTDGDFSLLEMQNTLLDADAEPKLQRRFSANKARDVQMFRIYDSAARFARFTSGVNIRTCGHTAHLACFKAYVATLNISQHHPAFPGEHVYSCPMCRQPVNGILPLKPEIGVEKTRLHFDVRDSTKTAEFMRDLITTKRLAPVNNNELYPYFTIFSELEDLCRRLSAPPLADADNLLADYRESISFRGYRNKSQGLLLGIVRTNIDYQLMLGRRGIMSQVLGADRNRKLDILKHLMYKTRMNQDVFADSGVVDQLTKFVGSNTLATAVDGEKFARKKGEIGGGGAPPPLLLYDERSVMCLFCSYVLPDEALLDVDKLELCKFVYRLAVCMALCNSVLGEFKRISKEDVHKLSSGRYFVEHCSSPSTADLAEVCDFVCETVFERLNVFFSNADNSKIQNDDEGVKRVATAILSSCERAAAELTRFFVALMDEHNLATFLYAAVPTPSQTLHASVQQFVDDDDGGTAPSTSSSAAAISEKHVTSGDSVTAVNIFAMNFASLFKMIFAPSPSTQSNPPTNASLSSSSTRIVECLREAKSSMVEWVDRLDEAIFEPSVEQLVSHSVREWRDPALLPLPASYDAIFSRFFGTVCSSCNSVPSSPMICMVCGELCCFDRCCDRLVAGDPGGPSAESEVERHANLCSFGGGCFLALNSSLVIVLRNAHAIIWGSVYLDAYGEEDRNLRRGKPLFLSAHRFQRLEEDWLRQNFVRKGTMTGLRGWLSTDQLAHYLREAHYYA